MSVSSRLSFLILLLFWGCQMEEPAQPVAKFTVSNDNCIGPCTVSFTDASENTSVYTWTYSWDFGDGSTSLEKNPVHNYKGAGNFIVKFTLNGKYGSAAYTDTVVIKTIPIPKPVAGFTIIKGEYEVDKKITFTNTSKNAVTYKWEFGDGSKSAELSPEHQYLKAGIFVVKLIVSSTGGTDSTQQNIEIKAKPIPAPIADFTFETDDFANTEIATTTFSNKSQNATSYQWGFGDNKSSQETSPKHEYPRLDKDSTYTVKLTATGPSGVNDKSQFLTIKKKL